MKAYNLFKAAIVLLITLWSFSDLLAQNPNRVVESKESRCSKKFFCEDFYGEYDFRGQTSFGEFKPGDTIRSKIIVYAGQDYRIFACGHKNLGDLRFKVIEPIKETKKVVKDIKKEDVIEYELDEYGSAKYDDKGEMIVKSKRVRYDTIYERQTTIREKQIFDNMNNKNNASFWEVSCSKTRRLVVEVIIPEGDPEIFDCVNIYVGRKTTSSKKMSQF
jgi:hypothetical protein